MSQPCVGFGKTVSAVVLFLSLVIGCGQQKEASAESELTGIVWKWQNLATPVEKIEVDSPNDYTLEFLPEGRLTMKADCNRGSAAYKIDGKSIQVGPIASTRAMCPPGSLSDQYLKSIEAAAIYWIEGDTLYLDLKYDSGTMKFARNE